MNISEDKFKAIIDAAKQGIDLVDHGDLCKRYKKNSSRILYLLRQADVKPFHESANGQKNYRAWNEADATKALDAAMEKEQAARQKPVKAVKAGADRRDIATLSLAVAELTLTVKRLEESIRAQGEAASASLKETSELLLVGMDDCVKRASNPTEMNGSSH